jgi:uncharacterized protein YkwD
MLIRSRTLAAAALAAAALAASTSPNADAATCRGGDVMPKSSNLRAVRATTLCLLNHERAMHGLHRVRPNAKLRRAAKAYSRTMVQGRFFAHVSPSGSTLIGRVSRTGYLAGTSGWSLGENLAWGSGPRATPHQIMQAWMASPGHRHNILTARFTDIGIGIATGAPANVAAGTAAATYTTDFGERKR